MAKCLICENENSEIKLEDYGQINIVICPNCGNYIISKLTMNQCDYKSELNRAKISHWIRTNQSKTPVELKRERIEDIIKNFSLPSPQEQADNLLLWLGDNYPIYGRDINIALENIIALAGTIDKDGILLLFDYFTDKGFLLTYFEKSYRSDYEFVGQISFLGWERCYELQRTNKNSRLAFMAMKFNEEPLTTVYNSVMKKAVEQTGFTLRDLGENNEAGLIDAKLRVEIRRSKFLIADLTHNNNGAYWEAGFAEGLGMPVIYVCEEEKFKADKSHFDTNHHLTVLWKNDEEGLKKFADKLKATIRDTLPNDAIMED